MTRSESLSNLATALAKAQAEMPVAAFDATNPFLKSKYATLGAVIQASRPILAKHKLSLVQFPISGPNLGLGNSSGQPNLGGAILPGAEKEAERQLRPTGDCIGIESILAHESGEFIAERILIPLAEEKGKSKVQSAGSTLTYLRRYSWASILGMYSDEDTDGGSATGQYVPRGSISSSKSSSSVSAKPAAALPPPPFKPHNN
jgi:hypothetical protein